MDNIKKTNTESRRSFIGKFGAGLIILGLLGEGYAFLRSLIPNVLYETPQRFKVGNPDDFPEGAKFLEDKRIFIFKEKNVFHSISAMCTHLGCTVKMVNLNQPKKVKIGKEEKEIKWEFHCPCHGSKFYADGTNYAGPAPKSLIWYKLEIAPEDGQLVVNMSEEVKQGFRLTV
jgi:menaquinol-cytochrome c reductase iron-sulfur subunit